MIENVKKCQLITNQKSNISFSRLEKVQTVWFYSHAKIKIEDDY